MSRKCDRTSGGAINRSTGGSVRALNFPPQPLEMQITYLNAVWVFRDVGEEEAATVVAYDPRDGKCTRKSAGAATADLRSVRRSR